MAKNLMIQGTMSNAGKSIVTAGILRVLKQDGYRVAPFKSQNMALNSYITKDGFEMGRAHVMQAEAAGLALRAAGRGLKVIFAQFMKGRASGEVDALAQIPDVMVLRASKDYGFYSRMSEADRNMQKKEHDSILDTIFEHVYKKHDVSVVVLDELASAYEYNQVDRAKTGYLLENHEGVEIVITGRNPDEALIRHADYITEMKKIKHPFDLGISAREGIEY